MPERYAPRALSFISALFLFIACWGSIFAEEEKASVSIASPESRLIILPFENDSGITDLSYLENGLPEVMVSSFSRVGFTVEKRQNLLFYLSPYDGRRIPRTVTNSLNDVFIDSLHHRKRARLPRAARTSPRRAGSR